MSARTNRVRIGETFRSDDRLWSNNNNPWCLKLVATNLGTAVRFGLT